MVEKVRRIDYWATTIVGRVLRGFFALILLVRRPRPIHARGLLLSGLVVWRDRPLVVRSGIPWIDDPPARGSQQVTARLSRSVGLPPQLPDVIGLALRLETGKADIELASTGFDVVGRFLLLPHRRPDRAWLGTLFPYRGEHGPILVAARTRRRGRLPASMIDASARLDNETWVLDLYFASPRSKWHPFAEIRLSRHPGPIDSTALRFDAVRNPLPGADTYAWTRRLRQPSYLLVQD